MKSAQRCGLLSGYKNRHLFASGDFLRLEGGIFNFQRDKTDPPQAQAAVQAGAYGGGAAGRGGAPGDPAGGAGERRRGERPQG